MDAFQKFPQFIDTDIRINRFPPAGYHVNYKQMLRRHQALLPAELVAGKSVLDLGCCVAAAGAWVLDLGASSYTGVELQKDFAKQSRENLSTSFDGQDWQIIESSVEEFFVNNTQTFDIVYAGGIIYASLYYQEFLKNIANISNVAVVIESKTPDVTNAHWSKKSYTEFWPIVEYSNESGMVHENGDNLKIRNATPSIGAVSILLEELGFEMDFESYNKLKGSASTARYGSIFYKKQNFHTHSAENLYKNNPTNTVLWETAIPDSWVFDKNIAKGFVQHARQHIPDYDKVIDLSVKICRRRLKDTLYDRVIDIGCATGETISRLHNNGVRNLIGVDNSQAMLDQCNFDIAGYVLSDKFPVEYGLYDAVICNWTLHFIKNKTEYLTDIFNGMNPGGFLILTDKTENSGISLELYHEFKRSTGVSNREIQAKAQSVKDIMFIDPPGWYTDTLRDIGFVNVAILNVAPCFTTFVAFKNYN